MNALLERAIEAGDLVIEDKVATVRVYRGFLKDEDGKREATYRTDNAKLSLACIVVSQWILNTKLPQRAEVRISFEDIGGHELKLGLYVLGRMINGYDLYPLFDRICFHLHKESEKAERALPERTLYVQISER